MARKRGVVHNGNCGLELLVQKVLNEKMDKNEQMSQWSAAHLSEAQLKYATLDCIKAIEIHKKLSCMMDLSA